jgi:hypothetical protein
MIYDTVGYGRLDFLLAITLPADEYFGIDEPQTHVLAHITEAKDVDNDATMNLVTYREYGRSFILDVKNVENVCGRILTKGVVGRGEWAIIDRSAGVARTNFQVDEHESGDENDK